MLLDLLHADADAPRTSVWLGVTAADAEPYVADSFPGGGRPGNESPLVPCAARRATRAAGARRAAADRGRARGGDRARDRRGRRARPRPAAVPRRHRARGGRAPSSSSSSRTANCSPRCAWTGATSSRSSAHGAAGGRRGGDRRSESRRPRGDRGGAHGRSARPRRPLRRLPRREASVRGLAVHAAAGNACARPAGALLASPAAPRGTSCG